MLFHYLIGFLVTILDLRHDPELLPTVALYLLVYTCALSHENKKENSSDSQEVTPSGDIILFCCVYESCVFARDELQGRTEAAKRYTTFILLHIHQSQA